ncbi:hypothetical protein RB195_011798 [Necator americanus]|uniref:von Willebrand factor type A domain protein n=1 Tax=Necator americanus TaxID=51031 RepID=A0ABR1D426_NECAM
MFAVLSDSSLQYCSTMFPYVVLMAAYHEYDVIRESVGNAGGTGSTTIYDFSYKKQQICTNIEKLWSNVDFENAGNVPLSRTIRNLFNNFGFDDTSLLLFTGDRDQNDVDAAASQVDYYISNKLAVDFSIVVVNYGNCSFSSWRHTDEYDALTVEPNLLSQYVDDSVCVPTFHLMSSQNRDHTNPCNLEPSYVTTLLTTLPTTTIRTTKDSRSTKIPSTARATTGLITSSSTHSPTQNLPDKTTRKCSTAPATAPSIPTLPPASITSSGCDCVLQTVWLDIFLLMEATTSMKPGIDAATDYVVSALSKLTIGQAEQYQTRFGVIRYASSVELIADLDTYTSTSDLFDLTITTYNESGTNIEGAIRLATDRFVSSKHRAAARPVLVIVGNSYKMGAWNDPAQVAATFRTSGTIITIEYVQQHGLQVPILRSIASPNYNLTNQKDDGSQLRADELRNLLCEVSMFEEFKCKDVPVYFQQLAHRTCFDDHNSSLTLVEDAAKDAFLRTIFPAKTMFWLGLTNDGNGWQWPGGYSLGFSNWGPNQPAVGKCAYMQQYSGFKFAWFSDDCTNDHYYICQSKPCDSTSRSHLAQMMARKSSISGYLRSVGVGVVAGSSNASEIVTGPMSYMQKFYVDTVEPDRATTAWSKEESEEVWPTFILKAHMLRSAEELLLQSFVIVTYVPMDTSREKFLVPKIVVKLSEYLFRNK